MDFMSIFLLMAPLSSQLHFREKHNKLFCAIKYIFRLVMDFEKCLKSTDGEFITKLHSLFKTVPLGFFITLPSLVKRSNAFLVQNTMEA